MIPSAFFYLIGLIINLVNYVLPNWTLWPASVERGFTLVGGYAYWLDPWIPMHTFWAIVMYDAAFAMSLLPFIIFSRAFRIKLFKNNE
jgi:hypothetical protein